MMIFLLVFSIFYPVGTILFLGPYFFIPLILFIRAIFSFCKNRIISRNLSIPRLVAEPQKETFGGRIEYSFYRIYALYWSFIGVVLILLGVNVFQLFDFVAAVFSKNSISYDHSDLYLLILIVGWYLLRDIYKIISNMSNDAIEAIINFYKFDFPYVKIKTELGEVSGQLNDIQNKFLVTLSEKKVLKIIPWNKVVILEANHINANEHIILDNSSLK
jgi:hypothetical protein